MEKAQGIMPYSGLSYYDGHYEVNVHFVIFDKVYVGKYTHDLDFPIRLQSVSLDQWHCSVANALQNGWTVFTRLGNAHSIQMAHRLNLHNTTRPFSQRIS